MTVDREVPPLPWTSPALLSPWPDSAGDPHEIRDATGRPVFHRNWREGCAAARHIVLTVNEVHRVDGDGTPRVMSGAEYARLAGVEDVARALVDGWDNGFPVGDYGEGDLIDRLRSYLPAKSAT